LEITGACANNSSVKNRVKKRVKFVFIVLMIG